MMHFNMLLVVRDYALIAALIAMVMDLRFKKVSNRFLIISILVSIVLRIMTVTSQYQFLRIMDVYSGGGRELGTVLKVLLDSFLGAAVPVALLGWLFPFRMIGAGDIKLLANLGILLGLRGSLQCLVLSMVFGALIAVGIMWMNGNLAERFAYFRDYVQAFAATRQRVPYRGEWDDASNFHLTVPVFMAVLMICLF